MKHPAIGSRTGTQAAGKQLPAHSGSGFARAKIKAPACYAAEQVNNNKREAGEMPQQPYKHGYTFVERRILLF
jgi:hypothetical protein